MQIKNTAEKMAAKEERLVEVELMGQTFSFYTAANDEELETTLALVRDLVDANPMQKKGTITMGKMAVLACLNIASRHIKLQQDFESYRRDSEQRLRELSNDIRSLIKE